MRRMMACLSDALERGDEALRRLLLGACRSVWVWEGLTLLAFFALTMTRTFTQLTGASVMQRAATVLLLCVPLFAMLHMALHAVRRQENSVLSALAACALCAVAMLARLSFIERSSGDYDIYLADWMAKLAAGSFGEGMQANIGEYNVLYQYILFLITRLPVPPLYAVKAVSFLGDAFVAAATARLAGRDGKDSLIAFAAALLLPTMVLNGGMFAQCDSLYAACALWGLALALDDHPVRAAACFALSLAFKLQAMFILPMVAVLWAHQKLKLRDAVVFVGTLLLVALPALLGGKGLMEIIGIYTAQTGLYTGLNYNAANFFALFNTTGLDVYAYGNFGMALAFGACAALVYAGCVRKTLRRKEGVQLALTMVLLIVFCLPRMHERYFYLALPLGCAWAARRGGKAVMALGLMEMAMLASHWETMIPLYIASLMMLTGIILVISDWKRDCEPEKL